MSRSMLSSFDGICRKIYFIFSATSFHLSNDTQRKFIENISVVVSFFVNKKSRHSPSVRPSVSARTNEMHQVISIHMHRYSQDWWHKMVAKRRFSLPDLLRSERSSTDTTIYFYRFFCWFYERVGICIFAAMVVNRVLPSLSLLLCVTNAHIISFSRHKDRDWCWALSLT